MDGNNKRRMLYNRGAPIPLIKGSPMARKTIVLDAGSRRLHHDSQANISFFPECMGIWRPIFVGTLFWKWKTNEEMLDSKTHVYIEWTIFRWIHIHNNTQLTGCLLWDHVLGVRLMFLFYFGKSCSWEHSDCVPWSFGEATINLDSKRLSSSTTLWFFVGCIWLSCIICEKHFVDSL